jgi:PAS domain S-box-containing protein
MGLTLALESVTGQPTLLLLHLAVVAVALWWGPKPGIFSLLLAAFFVYLLIDSHHPLNPFSLPAGAEVRLGLFLLSGLLLILLSSFRTRAEQALQGREDLLRKMLTALPVGIWQTDHAGRVVMSNSAAQEIRGGPRLIAGEENCKGRWVGSGKSVEVEEWAEARAILKGETSLGDEIEIECPDGTRKVILNSAVPLRNEQLEIRGAIIVSQDISDRYRMESALRAAKEELETQVRERTAELQTANEELRLEIVERRKAEELLRQTQSRLKLQIDRMPMGCIVWDSDFRVSSWNPAAERIFGFTAAGALGKQAYELIVPEDVRPDIDAVWQRLPQADATASSVNENRTKDGRKILCDWHNTPLCGPDERVTGLLSMVQDITERHSLEEQFRQAQKLDAIGKLAGGIAHDFNNLLTAIIGHSDLLLMRTSEGDSARLEIEEIRRAADRAALLTTQILAFSRKQILEAAIVDLNKTVKEAAQMLQRLLGEDIRLETNLAPGLGRVRVDPGKIGQVLLNLAVNARDAMPRGGVLVIETANVYLDDDYARNHFSAQPGPHVLLAVSDTGCGMDAATQARLFEPFFTTKAPGKGTGLGLSTVYGIVKQSGGNIWVYSELGGGTTVKVYLPRVEGSVETLEQTPAVGACQ